MLFFLSSTRAIAAPTLIVNEELTSVQLGYHLDILQDPEGTLSISDIEKPDLDRKFNENTIAVPNYGFTSTVFWARLSVANNLKYSKEIFIELDIPWINYVDLYIEEEDGFKQLTSGEHYPFENRPINYRNVVFPVDFLAGEQKTLYFRIHSDDAISLPFILWNPEDFRDKKDNELLSFGLYFGALIVMVVYNLFLFFSTRDSSFFYYVFYLSSSSFLQFSLNGLSYQYLWPNQVWWANTNVPFFTFLTLFGLIQFTRSFLSLNNYSPNLEKLSRILSYASVLGSVFALLAPVSWSIPIAAVLGIIVFSHAIMCGVVSLSNAYRPSRYYLMAFAIFLIGAIIYLLSKFGSLPIMFITQHGLQLGSIIEIILLSLGLADRINLLQIEKENNKKYQEQLQWSKLLTRFLRHELSNQISGIAIALQMIRRKSKAVEVSQYVDRGLNSVGELRALLNKASHATRIEDALSTSENETINIAELIDELLIHYAEAYPNIEFLLQEYEALNVSGSSLLLGQLIRNILDNAIRHTTSNTPIRIEIGDNYLTIENEGDALPENADYLFNLGNPENSENSGLFGMGLYVSNKIANAHKAKIEANPLSYAKGAQFKILFST